MVVDDAILERIILRRVCKIKVLCTNVAVGYSRSYKQEHGRLPNVNVILINYPVYAIHNTKKKGLLMWIRCLCVKLDERGRHTFVFLFQPYDESSRNGATYLQSRGI